MHQIISSQPKHRVSLELEIGGKLYWKIDNRGDVMFVDTNPPD